MFLGCSSDTPVGSGFLPHDGAVKLFDIPNAGESFPEPTPDGRYIIFVEHYGEDYGCRRYLARYELETGEITRITNDGEFRGGYITVSPDGKYLAYTKYDGIWVMPTDGGNPVQVSDDFVAGAYTSWKPNGEALVYSSFSGMEGLLKEVDFITGTERVLISERYKSIESGYYTPDGTKMLVTIMENDGFIYKFEIALFDTDTWEKDETLLYTSNANPPWYYFAGPWSPDGTKFLMVMSKRGLASYLTSYDVIKGNVKELTFTPRSVLYPKWSPDGSKAYFDGGPVGESMPDENGIFVIEFND